MFIGRNDIIKAFKFVKTNAQVRDLQQEKSIMAERSINIGGSNYGGVLNTGDHVSGLSATTQNSISPADVDIIQELKGLREILGQLQSPEQSKIGRALDDAEEDAAKPEPNKTWVQQAVERAIQFAKGATDFAEVTEKLALKLTPIALWLGLNAQHFIPLLGF